MRGPLTEELSPREWAQLKHESEMVDKQIIHAENMGRMNIELAKLEAQWNSWLSLPKTIIKLPILFLFGIAYICSVFTKKELPAEYWEFLRK